ncbi:hypothetical protein BH10PSE17_BH10PSE17_24160 [soil metagenome]
MNALADKAVLDRAMARLTVSTAIVDLACVLALYVVQPLWPSDRDLTATWLLPILRNAI